MITCPRCGAQNPANAALCARCSSVLAPMPVVQPPAYNDPLGKIIPTKNGSALAAYYLGLFSILPLLGLAMGIIAIVQGIKGLRLSRENPNIPGKGHAGVGIGCGSIGLLFNLIIVFGIVAALLSKPKP